MQAGQINEQLVATGGQFSAFIASGSSTTTLKTGAGRLCRIIVTTAGTASFTVFDNTAGSGNAIYVSSATPAVGTIIDLEFPVQIGITVVNQASGAVLAVSWD